MEAIWDWLAGQTNADIVAYFKHYYCLTYYKDIEDNPDSWCFVYNWATRRGMHYHLDQSREWSHVDDNTRTWQYCIGQEVHTSFVVSGPSAIRWNPGVTPVPGGLPVPKWLHKEVNNL